MSEKLTRSRWNDMPPSERLAFAGRLSCGLPSGFTFREVRWHTFFEKEHAVALFQFQGATFALIPGDTIRLGYDASRLWEPNPEELKSWRQTAREDGHNSSIQEHVWHATSRPRTVTIPSLLVEATPNEVGWEEVALDDPEVREIVKGEDSEQSQVTIIGGDREYRVGRDFSGTLRAERAVECTHADIVAKFAASGFRLPTSDEWEYLCGAGASTLFRWGDHAPCDRYPTDLSPDEATWRREWALSGGNLKYPPGGFASAWDWHRRANAFGLNIAWDSYKCELVAEPDRTRGGDEGCAICGGAGFFVGWLTLATAYFEEDSCRRDPAKPVHAGFTIARRVLTLG